MQTGIHSLRILELGDAAATGFCGKLFAGLGASVVHARLDHAPGAASMPTIEPTMSTDYCWYNTGKSNVAIDPAQTKGRHQLERLLAAADVVLDGLGPGVLEKLGFDIAALRAANPATVIVRVSAFGQNGPYRDFLADEITLYSMSGLANSTGDGAREPLNAGGRVCSTAGGQKAFAAALLALLRRNRTGRGDVVDLSLLEIGLDLIEIGLITFLAAGTVPRRNNDEHPMVPWRTYPCKDGEVLIVSGPARRWLKAAEVFGAPKLCKELVSITSRMANRKEVEQLMMPWLLVNDRRTIYHTMQGYGLACSYLATIEEALVNTQNTARKAFVEIDQPGLGRCKMPDAPFKSEGLPWRTLPAPQPHETLNPDALWTERRAAPAAAAAGALDAPPLQGIRVIDFSHDWAGPHAARLLADYGADVIKLEYPQHLDGMRGGSFDKVNSHPRFWQLHRGKRSITLDLHIPEHLDACRKLIASADVVLENSRPGVMDRLGVGHEAMLGLNPRLVFISLSAFGSTGPESSYAGYGGTMEAICGLQSITAYDPRSPRMRIREMDVLNGVFGTCAVLAALLERESTGRGQWIDLSESETAAWFIGEFFAETTLKGASPLPQGNRHPRFVQNMYACAGEDRWLAITVRDDREWNALLGAIGAADLAGDPRLATPADRRANQNLIDARVAAWTKERSNEEAMNLLQAAGVPAGAVFNMRDLAKNPQLEARKWFRKSVEGTALPGLPFHFADVPERAPTRGPKLGEHNEELLAALVPRKVWPDLSADKLRFADHVDLPPPTP